MLYAASGPDGAFAETLARFRPTATMRNLPIEGDEHLMAVGAVPADWRTRRQLVRFRLNDPLPFLDVDTPETHTFLTAEMAPALEVLGVDCLDIAHMRSANRFLTREVAQWAYAAMDDEGHPIFSGIRYASRLGAYECWAIFDGTEVEQLEARAIERTNSELEAIARSFDLTIH